MIKFIFRKRKKEKLSFIKKNKEGSKYPLYPNSKHN